MKIRSSSLVWDSLPSFLSLVAGFLIVFAPGPVSGQSQAGPISGPAYEVIGGRVVANQTGFYVYVDQDSGFNHGFPSGFFASPGNLSTIHIDAGCVDDPTAANGCSVDPNALDRTHGTVMRISFDPQATGNFAGVNIEEPENYGALLSGNGYDLSRTANLVLDIRSPDNAAIQLGVGQCVTNRFLQVPRSWTTITIPLSSLVPPASLTVSCPPTLNSVHFLFTVVTNDRNAPTGGTVLLDNIHFDPLPASQKTALGFPVGNQTFGVVPQQNAPIPPDQLLRNLTTTYESALAELALLARGAPQDLSDARIIPDSFDYALHHDNHGDPLPVATDGSIGLHSAYENGDIALFNTQQPPKQGQAGDVRLAGFTATTLCPSTGFCLVLDGATGGNNSFAILTLVAAYEQFGDVRYLNDALTVGQWIVGNLKDNSGTGYGGYFFGYPDQGMAKILQTNKSIENNADIFAAFTALAVVEAQLGNSAAASNWTAAANVAGDFVMQMFDSTNGRFNAGTVPLGTASGPGVCPNGLQKGNDIIDTCDFLDANTFTTLAMAGASRYQSQIDWRQPVQYVLDHFAQTITAGGKTYQGFDIVSAPVSGANGVAWEFTGQIVEAMHYVDQLYSDTRFESSATSYLAQIDQAQVSAPFGDGVGLVASTLQGGDTLPPVQQCLETPFQCIAERVGLAATTWGIFAEQKLNFSSPFPVPSLSSTNVGFPGQPVTTTSVARTVTISNAGAAALPISSMTASGDFAVASTGTTCSTSLQLPAGGSCVIAVTFTPGATGLRSGTLTINGNAQAIPINVALSGAGTDFQVALQNGVASTMTVTAGQPPATYMLQINPLPSPPVGGASFTGTVTVSCAISGPTGGIPPTCGAISPNVANPNGNPVAFSLMVSTTTRRTAGSPRGLPSPPIWMLLAILTILALLILNAASGRVRLRAAISVMTLLLLILFVGCPPPPPPPPGNSGTGTLPGTYTITVTGTFTTGSVSIPHSMTQTLSLTVN